jgi:gamma-glutamylcyclotransferase (GGCT)/AIG2-like uncharacterized protein YtfP
MGDLVRLFVYGTLMRGESNAQVLSSCNYLGTAETAPGYRLVALPGFPGLLAGGKTRVKGELYMVDSQVLAALDGLEDSPSLFRRARIQLSGGDWAEAYFGTDPSFETAPTIVGGDWRQHPKR